MNHRTLAPQDLWRRASVLVLVGVTIAAGAPGGADEPREKCAARTVSTVGITVSDLDEAVAFYAGVLDFERTGSAEVAGEGVERLTGVFGARCLTATMQLGQESIVLTEYLAPEGRPIPADSRSNDRWFQHIAIVVSDIDRAYAHLRSHRVRHASSGPQTLPQWNEIAAGISAFYFKDLDGHVLEVIHFPSGKGDPRWHQPTQSLFLGIDHTAIVVTDTERSVAFYGGALGLRVVGASENHGAEQEHLNNIFGARLRITTLRAPSGLGVELLEYLAPTDGRPYPSDGRANDLWNWHTTIIMPDVKCAAETARSRGGQLVSAGVVEDTAAVMATSRAGGAAVLLRDPDGHAVVLAAEPASP